MAHNILANILKALRLVQNYIYILKKFNFIYYTVEDY